MKLNTCRLLIHLLSMQKQMCVGEFISHIRDSADFSIEYRGRGGIEIHVCNHNPITVRIRDHYLRKTADVVYDNDGKGFEVIFNFEGPSA